MNICYQAERKHCFSHQKLINKLTVKIHHQTNHNHQQLVDGLCVTLCVVRNEGSRGAGQLYPSIYTAINNWMLYHLQLHSVWSLVSESFHGPLWNWWNTCTYSQWWEDALEVIYLSHYSVVTRETKWKTYTAPPFSAVQIRCSEFV